MNPEDDAVEDGGKPKLILDQKMHRELRIYDPMKQKTLAKNIDDINKRMKAIGDVLQNTMNLPTSAGTNISASSVANRVMNSSDGLEKAMIKELSKKLSNEVEIPVSSHVRNKIQSAMDFDKSYDVAKINTVTIYKDPSHKYNAVYFLVVNGDHRVAKWDEDDAILTVLNEDVCRLPLSEVGMHRTQSIRSISDGDSPTYYCGLVQWERFVQHFATAGTHMLMPVNRSFVSNEFAEGMTDDHDVIEGFKGLPDTGQVFVLTHSRVSTYSDVTLDVQGDFGNLTTVRLMSTFKDSNNGRTSVIINGRRILELGQDAYTKCKTVLRESWNVELDHENRISFITERTDLTPVNIVETFLNLCVGFEKDRKDYALGKHYMVYRNKIRR